MNDNDPFSRLWQQQKVTDVNLPALKRQWRRVKISQWTYFTLDLLSTIMLPVMLYFIYQQLNTYEVIWFVGLALLSLGFFAYLVWLRRFSLGFGKERLALSNYYELVKAQYQQNIKLARLSKTTALWMPAIMLSFLLVGYFSEAFEGDALLRKLTFSVVFLGILTPGIWIWAHKREQKFRRALDNLQNTLV